MGEVVAYAKLLDRSYWPREMTLGDVLYRLALVSPQDYRAIDTIARAVLEQRWPKDHWSQPRTP